MAILRWLFITVFAFSFLHTSMLVGLLYKIPLAPQLYERHLEKSGKLWLLYPVKAYGAVGKRLWESSFVDEIFTHLYQPTFKRLGKDLKPEDAARAIDVTFWNWVVLGSLAAGLLVPLLASGPRRR